MVSKRQHPEQEISSSIRKPAETPLRLEPSRGHMPVNASKEVAALVRDWIRNSYDAGESYTSLARRLGVSKATITHVRDGGRDVGRDVEQKAARLLYNGSIDELRRVAHKRYEEQRAKEEQAPNRAEAADICRRSRRVSSEAIDSVLAEPITIDRPTLEWIDIIRLRDLELSRLRENEDSKKSRGPKAPSR